MLVSFEIACPYLTVGCLHVSRTVLHSSLKTYSNYCLDAHQHYLWDTCEDKYNKIFLKEYNSDEIGRC